MRKPRTRQAMIAFLSKHFRYDTMNSWNAQTSYAKCVKISRLGLTMDQRNACYDMLEVGDSFEDSGFNGILRDFDCQHDYAWQIGQNGRSGGYLVLYSGGREPTGHKSFCSACGQRNFQLVTEGDDACGVCGEKRTDYITPPMRVFSKGIGTDGNADFEEWDTDSLRSRVNLVWDFDKTCERACRAYVRYATNHKVEDETILVSKSIKVAV